MDLGDMSPTAKTEGSSGNQKKDDFNTDEIEQDFKKTVEDGHTLLSEVAGSDTIMGEADKKQSRDKASQPSEQPMWRWEKVDPSSQVQATLQKMPEYIQTRFNEMPSLDQKIQALNSFLNVLLGRLNAVDQARVLATEISGQFDEMKKIYLAVYEENAALAEGRSPEEAWAHDLMSVSRSI